MRPALVVPDGEVLYPLGLAQGLVKRQDRRLWHPEAYSTLSSSIALTTASMTFILGIRGLLSLPLPVQPIERILSPIVCFPQASAFGSWNKAPEVGGATEDFTTLG